MNRQRKMAQNWLTRKPRDEAIVVSLIFGVLLVTLSYFYLNELFAADRWMVASGELVFERSQYWRLWTTLFAHADTEHLLANLSLLLPLSFLLTGYFGIVVFPLSGVLIGGMINYTVLKFMPATVGLVGISGLVYWMGAVWLTLYLLIDRRRRLRQRIAGALFLTVVLFIPESYKAEVSYLSHFVGYMFGIVFASGYYVTHHKQIKAAEVFECSSDEENLEMSSLDSEALAANGGVELYPKVRSVLGDVQLLK